MTIAAAAEFLCSTWPVFPCQANKRPLPGSRGFYDATQDPAEVRRMFSQPGAALIGVPTGPASGLLALDIDVAGGGETWLEANRWRMPRTRTHRTMSGGWHFLFLWPEGHDLGNTARKIAPGVDTRGRGGYVCAPPSPGYSIEDDAMPAPVPGWLLAILAPPPKAAVTYTPPARAEIPEKYALRALEGECEAVAHAVEGTRNHTLNVAAVKLGSLVATGALSESTVRAELRRAALHAGLDPRETDLTIQSGLSYGLTQPREIPERVAHVARGASHVAPSAPATGSGQTTDPETGEIMQPSSHLKDGPLPFPLLWFEDIKPSLDANDFVQGVLVNGSAAVVYGESNAGKTFWATDLALHVAAGKPWNGRRIEQGGVVYCVLEGGVGFRNRVTAWRNVHKPSGPVHFAAIQSGMNLLSPEADTPRLIASIKQAAERISAPIKLIVIDTLSRAFAGGNENASEDMGLLVQNMDEIRRETGACVLFIHHSGKDQAKGARGHSLLRAAIDTEIEVKASEDSGLKTATTVKQREIKKGEVFTFELEVIELGKNPHGEGVTTCVVRQAEPQDESTKHLSPGAKAGLVALQNALISAGKPAISRDIPDGVRVVTLEVWRREFYARSHLESPDAKRQAFHRSVKDLRASGTVGVMHDQAWIVEGKYR